MSKFLNFNKNIKLDKRFEFGKNWINFIRNLSRQQISESKRALIDLIGSDNLDGKKFLDVGCGSGLMSLVARELGAKVISFDFDKNSVNCSKKLKSKFMPGDDDWIILEGSVLDENYLNNFVGFDIVYSWGVLHHTGDMWKGLNNVLIPLKNEGSKLVIAIYNDQGYKSVFWRAVKKFYNINPLTAIIVLIIFLPLYVIINIMFGMILRRDPLAYFKDYRKNRGMSIYYDWIDWLGGYPYEFAKPEDIINFYKKKGFYLENIITTNSLGCNQFVFEKRL